jgi:hypothetical protein
MTWGWPTTEVSPPAAAVARVSWLNSRPARRAGALISLHIGWAVVASVAVLIIAYGAASLVSTLLPVPRRTFMAGGIVALGLSAGWAGPTLVGRVARHWLPRPMSAGNPRRSRG